MEANVVKSKVNGTGNGTHGQNGIHGQHGTHGQNGTTGAPDRLKLTLVESRPLDVEEIEPVLRTERDLKMVADQLSEALQDFEIALRAGGGTELAPRLRAVYDELVELQESAARELGRAVGDRVAALNRWKVRRGIDVAQPRR